MRKILVAMFVALVFSTPVAAKKQSKGGDPIVVSLEDLDSTVMSYVEANVLATMYHELAHALIDGLRGDANWRTGGWQGFQYQDFEATVDLGRRRVLYSLGASFLQDAKSWIWMPSEVVLSVSSDGAEFLEVARLTGDVADDAYGNILRDWLAQIDGVEARYVRVFARNYGTIPDWHPGHGEGAFIFIDEILVDLP